MEDVFFGFVVLIVLLIFFSVLFKVIVSSVKRQGIWGINFIPPNCPDCAKKLPVIRNPASFRQAMFGGATCSSCGCEADKWGNKIEVIECSRVQKQLRETPVNSIDPFDTKGKSPIEKVFEESDK